MHKIGLNGTSALWIFREQFHHGVRVPIGSVSLYRSSDIKRYIIGIWRCVNMCFSTSNLFSAGVRMKSSSASPDIFHLIEIVPFSRGYNVPIPYMIYEIRLPL